jgi:three-Cys-motif partner protein
VIFLDPFGNHVEWATLSEIAATKSLDVWYLFPLAGVYRNAPIAIDSLSDQKRAAVTRVLGTDDWMDHFYKEQEGTGDLFDRPGPKPRVRSVNVQGIESFVYDRLRSVFPHVARPNTLIRQNNVPAFSLFFAISNPDQNAWGIASRIAKSLLKPRSRGIHPKFGH